MSSELELPPPLTPADCDLRDLPSMLLDIDRLQSSRAWLTAKRTPELGFYLVNLWAAAFHQVPAGSVEDDEEVLADLARCSPRRWKRIREDVLRGWVRCSDGRLYNKTVAEKALEAWLDRLHARRWSAKSNAERHKTHFDPREHDEAIADTVRRLLAINPNSLAIKRKVSKSPCAPRNENLSNDEGKTQVGGGENSPDRSPHGLRIGLPVGSEVKVEVEGEAKIVPLLRSGGAASPAPPDGQTKQAKPDKQDPWAAVYSKAREVFGDKPGGIVTNLRKALGEHPNRVLGKICEASGKADPREFINGVLHNTAPPGTHVAAGRVNI